MRSNYLALVAALALSLPTAAEAGEGELHSFHCLQTCPAGAPATNDTVVREIYTLSSNRITKLADWVAYRITPDTVGRSQSRTWRADPWLHPDATLTPGDYEDAPKSLRIDRGHQAPLASFSGTPFSADTNILSNITPQASALNQGAWVRLEDRERKLAQRLKVAVHVYTGPLFERMMRPMPKAPEKHRVPSGYWKVVVLEDGRMSAFIFDQATPRDFDYCEGRAPLLEIELRARLELFPGRSQPLNALDFELGCASPPPDRPEPDSISG